MTSRRKFLTGALSGLLLYRAGLDSAMAHDVLRFGVLPVMSPRTSLETFQPLLDYLTRAGHLRIELLTSPDFQTLYQRIREFQYDFAILPPHMARLAQQDLGWQPMARCGPEHRSVLLALENGGPATLEELRGGTIAVLDRGALVVLIMLDALAERGLREGRDFNLLETRGYESSRLAVIRGQARAFVSRSQGFFNDTQRERFQILLDGGPLPGYVFIASPRLPPLARFHLSQSLLNFAATPAAGPLLSKLGYQSLAYVGEASMRLLDPYLDSTRKSLAAGP